MARPTWRRVVGTVAAATLATGGWIAVVAGPAGAAPSGSVHQHAVGHRPDQPTNLSLSPCFKLCSSPALSSYSSPKLTATVTDPDGGNLALVRFEVWNVDRSSLVASSGDSVTIILSGASASWTPALPRTDYAAYQWRVRGCDAQGCGRWSTWFAFATDTVNPAAPTVSSDDYPTGSWTGGPGTPGVFHFGANGSRDVTEFLWSLDTDSPYIAAPAAADGTASVTITPKNDGPHTLYAQSVDAAGNRSDTTYYRFEVKTPPATVGTWSFDGDTGTTATDTSGLGHDLTLHGGAGWTAGHVGAGAVQLDGSTGYLSSDGSLLNTTRSFTVAGWAYLTDTSHDQTLIAQDGDRSSAFALRYQADCGCWAFAMRDAGTGALISATSERVATSGQWTHLAGIYDAQDQQLLLYVDGVFQSSSPAFTAPTASSGPLTVGRGLDSGQPGSYWTGNVDEVGAYPRVLTGREIYYLANA